MARKVKPEGSAVPSAPAGAAPVRARRTRKSSATAPVQPELAASASRGTPAEAPATRYSEPDARASEPVIAEAQTASAKSISEPVSVEPQNYAAAPAEPVSERDEIAKIAYSYWEARGYEGGSAEEDWARAEEEYRRRRQSSTS